jgi:hypothetical protein
MKRLSAALILGFLILSCCFAQTQTGNASYNSSKPGLTISHSSLSFNTRVQVTNLRNNRSVEATVNGRIPINSELIAEISRDAGDALEMNKTGTTLVEIAVLPARGTVSVQAPASPPQTAAPETAPAQPAKASSPAPQGQTSSTPQEQAAPPPQILPVQTITEIEYVPVPSSDCTQPCYNTPLLVAILLLLILLIILLLVLLILLLRRFSLWPWYYPLWLRRYHRYTKKRGIWSYRSRQ